MDDAQELGFGLFVLLERRVEDEQHDAGPLDKRQPIGGAVRRGRGTLHEEPAVLELGRDVFGSRCSNCHGSSGGGGTGSRLAGTVTETYPDAADQVAVVRDGRRSMPSFGGTLSEAEIEAVVRYTREVLD